MGGVVKELTAGPAECDIKEVLSTSTYYISSYLRLSCGAGDLYISVIYLISQFILLLGSGSQSLHELVISL